jgi:hypothetical protein
MIPQIREEREYSINGFLLFAAIKDQSYPLLLHDYSVSDAIDQGHIIIIIILLDKVVEDHLDESRTEI